MKKFLVLVFIMSSCSSKSYNKIDDSHIEKLACDFMKTDVIPKMKDSKPYEVLGSKVIIKTVGDKINDYRFTHDHLSLSHEDSAENKRLLDSVIDVSHHPDSIISVTVNVGYKTKYKFGNITTDSIKLGYNLEKDKITYWPF